VTSIFPEREPYRGFEILVEVHASIAPPYRATIRRLGQAHLEPGADEADTKAELIARAKSRVDDILGRESTPP
jgi:hypothetical protein